MRSMKFFKRPSASSTSLEPLQSCEGSGTDEPPDYPPSGRPDEYLLGVPPSLRERSTSLTLVGEMPKAEKVVRSSSDISLASTVALDDSLNDSATTAALDAPMKQNEIEEMRNFIQKQKYKLPVLMDTYVDFIAHQIVGVMNTVMRYKDATEEARASRHDDRTIKGESPFYRNITLSILPAFQELVTHINSYSRASSRDIEERKFLCEQTKKKVDQVYKLITYLMEGEIFLENITKKTTAHASGAQNGYPHYQVQIRKCLIAFEGIYRAAEEIYRMNGLS